MKMPGIRYLLYGVLVLCSCNNFPGKIHPENNDTTEIIKQLFGLEKSESLYRDNPFGDTAIVQFDSVFIKHPPKINAFKYFAQLTLISSSVLTKW